MESSAGHYGSWSSGLVCDKTVGAEILRSGLNTGDIVYRPMIGVPGLFHYGILIDIGRENHLVAHHTASRGPVITTLDDFLEGKSLSGHVPSKLSGASVDEILDRFEAMDDQEFHALTNNCEGWAYRFTRSKYNSIELLKAVAYVAAFIVLIRLTK